MNASSNREHIIHTFQRLEKMLLDEEAKIAQKIADFALEKSWEFLYTESDHARQMQTLRERVSKLNEDYQQITLSNEDMDKDNDPLSAIERTTWEVSEGKIHVKTEANGRAYSNIIPVPLFKDIVACALQFIEQSKSVKTTDVTNALKNKIIKESTYKKSPRIPVYITFKILTKEEKFKTLENNSHKFELVGNKEAVLDWLRKQFITDNMVKGDE